MKKTIKTLSFNDWSETMIWRNMNKLGQVDILDEYVNDLGQIVIQVCY